MNNISTFQTIGVHFNVFSMAELNIFGNRRDKLR